MKTAWSRAFRTYLRANKIGRVRAAHELSRSVSTIHEWMSGTKDPSLAAQIQIEEWTKGTVRAQVPEWLRKSA
jgi:hypothetical protein